MKKLALVLAGIFLLLFLATGCQEKKVSGFMVPQGSDLIASVNINRILADVGWEEVYSQVYANLPPDAGLPPTLPQALDMLREQTGIDARAFTQAIIFARVTADDYVGAILVGTFEEKKFIQALGEKTGQQFTTQTYQGYTIYADESQSGGLAFVGNDLLIAGTLPAVKDALSVAAGKQEAATGPVREAYDSLGNPLLKMALAIPPELLSQMEQGITDVPVDLSALISVNMVTLSLDKQQEAITVKLAGRYPDAEAAKRAQSVIDGFRLLAQGFIPVPELTSFLNKIQVAVQNSWLQVNITTSAAEIGGVVEAVAKLAETGLPLPTLSPYP